MPHAAADDGCKLYFEETGSGTPVIFVHEYAGDMRSWEPQMRHFGQRYRAISYNARGYPPSDVPEQASSYSQARAADDILAVLDHLGVEKAHVVGLSMGGFATLHFGFRHPGRALSLTVAGCGYGAEPGQRERFKGEAAFIAETLKRDGMEKFAAKYAYGPTRVQFENKDPRGFAEFARQLAEHSALGAANTQMGVQGERPSLYELVEEMKALVVPTLVLTGDEDWPCLQPGAADEAAYKECGAFGDAELRAYDQHRRPGPVQSPGGRVPGAGGLWAVADAGPSGDGGVDHGDQIAAEGGRAWLPLRLPEDEVQPHGDVGGEGEGDLLGRQVRRRVGVTVG